MLTIEVFELNKDGQSTVGTIQYDGRKLSVQPVTEGNRFTLEDLIDEPTMIVGYPLDPKKDPELWIRNIYKMASTYLRCSAPQET